MEELTKEGEEKKIKEFRYILSRRQSAWSWPAQITVSVQSEETNNGWGCTGASLFGKPAYAGRWGIYCI